MKIVRTSGPFVYRELESGGYEVERDYWVEYEDAPEIYAVLNDGTGDFFGTRATLRKGFRFDGASGAVDSPETLAAYGLHDLGYRLLRQGKIGQALRQFIDWLMYVMLRRAGMFILRARYIYHACRLFGRGRAKRQTDKESVVITVPT